MMPTTKSNPKTAKRPHKLVIILIIIALVMAIGIVVYSLLRPATTQPNQNNQAKVKKNGFVIGGATKQSIDSNKILSGGPGRDGIPAIDSPQFSSVDEAKDIPKDTLGILVEHGGETRYYPYTILVWHEIVNDTIGRTPIAVTFCPLCGSAAVFDRRVKDETVRFGVSGLLYESNLLMYDDITESLWSQSLGKAVVGPRTGTVLKRLPTQLIEFSIVEKEYRAAKVLSTNTGYDRDYSINPYGGYDQSEEVLFEVSHQDTQLPAKTIMFVLPVGDRSLAFEQQTLEKNQTASTDFFGKKIVVKKDGNGEIKASVNGTQQHGYFEMWFSWVTQHKGDGELWKLKSEQQ